ncbi:PREDICTED: uncharacterized protein LOC100640141, partial [Amphimedon queenslandica]|uniref:HTH CENPB-type domain-containing protein n=1 Tax=Amphimedon queenslandica TaxID=400682 RepID=A0AAN0IIT0_AMPQE
MACKRKQWSTQSMEIAVASVREGTNGLREAARMYNLPVESLRRRVHDIVAIDCRPGPPTVLMKEEEDRLYQYLLEMADMGYGLNRETIMKLAFTIAEKTEKSHPFKGESAGRAWFDGFRRRYPRLTLRSPQPLSQARAFAGSPEIISDFFGKLGALYGRLNLLSKPMMIYNADEMGISVVHKPGKVVAELGRNHVYSVVSGERGKNHTIMACVSASAFVLPPMIIYPRKRGLPDNYKAGAVPNTLFVTSTNGWINSELYFEWLKFFSNNIPPARPVLLVQDGHSSHMSIEAIEYAKSNQIYILCLPSHTTHILQPLDIGVFKSFKSNFSKACTNYVSKNPGRVITPDLLSSLVSEVWPVSVTHLNIMSGFRKSGLFPFNPSVVNDRLGPSKVFKEESKSNGTPEFAPPTIPPSTIDSPSTPEICDVSSAHVLSDTHSINPTPSVDISPVPLPHMDTNSSVSVNDDDTELFTEEQEKLFSKRFEEGYDLYDPLFVTWLKIRHPYRCVSVSSDALSE